MSAKHIKKKSSSSKTGKLVPAQQARQTRANSVVEGMPAKRDDYLRGRDRNGDTMIGRDSKTQKISSPVSHDRTDYRRLRNMRDKDIDYSDIPDSPPDFFDKGKLYIPPKRKR